MSSLHDPKHPVWGLAKFAMVMIGLTFVLYTNAQSFDANELRIIGECALCLVAGKGFQHLVGPKGSGSD